MFKVRNFEYNGFMGRDLPGYAPYTATSLKEWTSDPGVGMFHCSDGAVRMIPTFALEGDEDTNILPPQPKTGVIFGAACRS